MRLKQQVATTLVLRLWHESVKRDYTDVVFHAPKPCSKDMDIYCAIYMVRRGTEAGPKHEGGRAQL
jgi:hypothetical protein